MNFYPGDQVFVYDGSAFIDDVLTPKSMLMRPATVVQRYGKCGYPDLMDVIFHHDGRRSDGHFTNGIVSAIESLCLKALRLGASSKERTLRNLLPLMLESSALFDDTHPLNQYLAHLVRNRCIPNPDMASLGRCERMVNDMAGLCDDAASNTGLELSHSQHPLQITI